MRLVLLELNSAAAMGKHSRLCEEAIPGNRKPTEESLFPPPSLRSASDTSYLQREPSGKAEMWF